MLSESSAANGFNKLTRDPRYKHDHRMEWLALPSRESSFNLKHTFLEVRRF